MRMPKPTSLHVLWSDGRIAPPLDPGTTVELGADDTADRLDRLYAVPPGPWVRMNMLGTLNARVTGPDGTSDSISNRADRAILKRIRAMSDAIVVGAQTVRQEKHMATGSTRLIIVTGSGDLSGHRISPEEAERGVTVMCPANAAAKVTETMPGANLFHPSSDHVGAGVSIADVLTWCRSQGLDRLVVEGGASLIGQFLDAKAIDEVCITQAPVFGRTDAPGLPGSSAERRYRRALVASDNLGFVYSRLVAEPDDADEGVDASS